MKYFVIDIHSHIDFTGSIEIMKKRFSEEEIFSRFQINRVLMAGLREHLMNPQKRIRDMEEKGITLSVLSINPPAFFYNVENNMAIELARFHNDRISEMVKNQPCYFSGMATLPLQGPAAALEELERAIRKLGLRGVVMGSNVNGRELGDQSFWPIYEAIEKLGVPIFIHPHNVAGMNRLQDYYFENLIGYPLDTTIAATNLIFSGVLESFPDLKIILAHGGGQLPYILGRIDHGYRVRPECQKKINKPPREFLNNFYFDTIIHSQEALYYLISIVGSNHVVLGSDYPYDMGDSNPLLTVCELPGITEEDRRKILQENAITLFNLQPP